MDEQTSPQQDPSVPPQIATVRAFNQQHRGVMPKRDPAVAAALPKPGIVNGACSGDFQYYGGRVISNVQVQPVFWCPTGIDSSITSGIEAFYQSVTNAAYWQWLSEYNTQGATVVGGGSSTNQVVGAGSALTPITISGSPCTGTVDDTAIQSAIAAAIASGKLPKPSVDSGGNTNTYYPIFFPKGLTITESGSSSCVAGGFCAYHGTVAASGSTPEFYYGVHPDMSSGSGCDTGCGSAPTLFQNQTSVASHELAEATTDAEVGLAESNGPPLAWYDTTNGEIGDICNAEQGTSGSYTVQLLWSQKNCKCQDSGGTCTPVCTGKQCGSDGCGGTCGTCPTGESCSASGQCTSTCVPACTGKQCGSDGCGGTCGTCPTGDTCSSAGQCTSSGGSCAHSECTSGKKLKKGCDSCVTSICKVDSYCCSVTWDSICVSEAGSVCGESC